MIVESFEIKYKDLVIHFENKIYSINEDDSFNTGWCYWFQEDGMLREGFNSKAEAMKAAIKGVEKFVKFYGE